MSVIIYNDASAVGVVIEDPNGSQFYNSLLAKPSELIIDSIDVINEHKGFDVITAVHFSEVLDSFGQPYGSNLSDVIDALNLVFTNSGGFSPPTITSATNINAVKGGFINYELVSEGGVGYEWDDIPTGMSVVDGNIRHLVGSISTNGVYKVSMKAINYFGEDSKTLDITVGDSGFINEKSITFRGNNRYLDGAATLSDPFVRVGDGTGANDAWSISFWFKPSRTRFSEQSIFNYGTPVGRIEISTGGFFTSKLFLKFGNPLLEEVEVETSANKISTNVWHHVLVTYDGGSTATNGNSFSMFIDGVDETSSRVGSYSGSISPTVNRLGVGLTQRSKLDEVAYWDSDVSSIVSNIYNLGIPEDLSLLNTPPSNWLRMGDGNIFPNINDVAGSMDYRMTNMLPKDITNDTANNSHPAVAINKSVHSIKLGDTFDSRVVEVAGYPKPSLTISGTTPNGTISDSAEGSVVGTTTTTGSGTFDYVVTNSEGSHSRTVVWEVK